MRVIFILLIVANVMVLAWGQGFFGVPPSEQGRDPQVLNQRNQHAIIPGKIQNKSSNSS